MGEEHFSNAFTGVGSVLLVAGAIQLFCRSMEIQRAKRGQIRVVLTWRNWSPRSVWLGVFLIVAGALLLGRAHFA